MYANEKVRGVLTSILERFKTGDIPQGIAYSMFPIPDIPAAKWSLCNRTLMFFADTQDARGFNQWKEAKRYVKKGAKAFLILAPRFGEKENGEGEEETFLAGFLAVPGSYRYRGYYSTEKREIALATQEETVFFHELSHAAHQKVLGQLKPGQDWKQEVVAELSAAVLCHLVGKDGDKHLGNSYTYIEKYAAEAKTTVLSACFQVLSDVEKVLKEILMRGGDNNESSSHLSGTLEQPAG